MIRVNGLSTLNFVSRPAFRSEENAPETVKKLSEEKANLTGTEALASYNLAIMNNAEKLDQINPLELIFKPEEEVEGEKIYTSEGKLHSIVKEDENIKTIYTPSKEDEDLIDTVQMIDKKANKIMKEQSNYIEDGKYNGAWIGEYSPNDGKLMHSTIYDKDGNVERATLFNHPKKDQTLMISRDVSENEYNMSFYSDKRDMYMTLDQDKNLVHLSDSKKVNNFKHKDTDIYFYNGTAYSIYDSEHVVIPNAFGHEKLHNPELVPAERYIPEIDLKGQEGEKSYYSNGAIEKNVIGDTTAYFDINGNLERVQKGNKEITIEGDEQAIVENLGDGKTRTTELYNNGTGNVKISTKESYSEIYFDENKRPRDYYEGTIDKNGEETLKLSLEFNEYGMLTDAWKR